MESIHGRRLIDQVPDRRRQTSAGDHGMPPLLRHNFASTSRSTQLIPIAHQNLAITHPQQFPRLGYRASARAEVDQASTRTAQNDPSYQNFTARNAFLGAAWPGVAAPLFRDRIAARVFPEPGTYCAAIVFG